MIWMIEAPALMSVLMTFAAEPERMTMPLLLEASVKVREDPCSMEGSLTILEGVDEMAFLAAEAERTAAETMWFWRI